MTLFCALCMGMRSKILCLKGIVWDVWGNNFGNAHDTTTLPPGSINHHVINLTQPFIDLLTENTLYVIFN